MTYPAHIRKKILAELEDSTYREVAARHRISPNTLATWKKQPQPKGSRRSTPRLLTEEVIRQDVAEHPDDYQWERAARLAARKTASARRSNAIASPLKKDFRHHKADEEKRREFLEVKMSMKHACIHLFMMKAASEKTSPVLTAMHHAGKNAQAYPDGAKHKPTLSVPCVALCHLLSLPLIAA